MSAATLFDQLVATASLYPDHDAVVYRGRRLTYAELLARAGALAGAFQQRLGLRRGDRIALWLPNRPEFVLAWYAATAFGAAVVPVNTRYKAEELTHILADAGARCLITIDRFARNDYVSTVSGLDRASLPHLEHVVVVESDGEGQSHPYLCWDDLAGSAPATGTAGPAASRDPDDLAVMIYTSGTTGWPKGVVLNHRNILFAMHAHNRWFQLDSHDRLLAFVPFYHVGGAVATIVSCVVAGATVICQDLFDAGDALALIQNERCTYIGGTPTHFHLLLSHPDFPACDVSSLEGGWIGGAYIPAQLVRDVLRQMGLKRFAAGYGSTETSSITTWTRTDDPVAVIATKNGVPVGNYEIKICDPETGRDAGPDEVGEICVRGGIVMQGYYNNPEATARAIDGDGWYHTGDLGRIDGEGYLVVTGRLKDMFTAGGANVYPVEIERVLYQHPAVDQVQVVGVPDARLGEVGAAWVTPAAGAAAAPATADALIAFCRERMANYKVPRYVLWMAKDEWPLTASGKVQKVRLRQRAVAELGLQEADRA